MTGWHGIGVLLRVCLTFHYCTYLQLFWLLSGGLKKVVWLKVVQGDLLTVYDLLTGYFRFSGDNRDSYLDGFFPAQHGPGMAFINEIGGPVLPGRLSDFRPMMWKFWTWRSDRFLVDGR